MSGFSQLSRSGFAVGELDELDELDAVARLDEPPADGDFGLLLALAAERVDGDTARRAFVDSWGSARTA